MGSLASELSFDHRPAFVPKSIHDLIRDVSSIPDAAERSSKRGDLIQRLEEEMRKIDAFKRELPMCMVLLGDAIMTLKQGSLQWSAPPAAQPVTAEFIPLKNDCGGTEIISTKEKEEDTKDEKLGTLDLQLCTFDNSNPIATHTVDPPQDVKVEPKRCELVENQSAVDDLLKTCKSRTGGREFIQLGTFSPVPRTVFPRKEDKVELPAPSLSLLNHGIKIPRETPASGAEMRANLGRSLPQTVPSISRNGALQQGSRKQRRCWSPELHRRFVSALQQLGGSQTATPKQIRELMQVDGLTNDEVKSHLQKYRLHNRRLPGSAGSQANQPVCVLGSLWPSQDKSDEADASKGISSQSGSPQGPLQLCTGGGPSTTGGDSMEDDEDCKSESFSWKSHHNIQGTGKVDV